MGKLEQESRKRLRKTRLQEALLQTIFSGGRLGADLIMPRVLESLLNVDLPFSTRKIETVRSAANRLTKRGLLKFQDGYYSLTSDGKRILKHWQMSNYQIKHPKKWDGKWRVVIFDIPEKKRAIRREMRRIFIEAGFQRLQDSVWIYPYDCEDVIGLMKMDMGIGKYLLYMIVDQLENDRFLRMDFDLI